MNFSETNEFSKDFKRLSKKYRSLPDDLLEFKKIVSEIPLGSGKHFVVLHNFEEVNPVRNSEGSQRKISNGVKILKARLFCKYLRGASLRIIYAYVEAPASIHFIELYFKGEQVNEDKGRINDFLRQFVLK